MNLHKSFNLSEVHFSHQTVKREPTNLEHEIKCETSSGWWVKSTVCTATRYFRRFCQDGWSILLDIVFISAYFHNSSLRFNVSPTLWVMRFLVTEVGWIHWHVTNPRYRSQEPICFPHTLLYTWDAFQKEGKMIWKCYLLRKVSDTNTVCFSGTHSLSPATLL